MSFSRKVGLIIGIVIVSLVVFFIAGMNLLFQVILPKPYEIKVSTPDEFFDAIDNGATFLRWERYGDFISLENDLDFEGYEIEPQKISWVGRIEGNGYQIKNYVINASEGDNIGMFGVGIALYDLTIDITVNYTGNGTNIGALIGEGEVVLRNVVINATVNAPAATNVGGVVGSCNSSSSTTENLTCNVNVVGMENVGGFMGYYNAEWQRPVFSGITVTGEVKAIKSNAGGIFGLVETSDKKDGATICESVNKSNVSAQGSSGGIVGKGKNLTIDNCKNEGEIVSKSGSAGGIGGYLPYCDISYCINEGKVYSEAPYVGGIAGYLETNSYEAYKGKIYSSNKNSGKIEGNIYVGGLFGYAQGYKILITRNENTGDVSGSSFVGGIIGGLDAGSGTQVTYCSNNANLVCSGSYCAGIIGGIDSLRFWDEADLSNMSTNTTQGLINGNPSTLLYNEED